MWERGAGSVTNVVSGVAFTPISGMGTYGVSKAVMMSLILYPPVS
jgi:short-subunit dehydrogenase